MNNYQNSHSHTHELSSTSTEFESFTFPIPPYDIKSSSFSLVDKLIFKGQLLPLGPSARLATILSLLSSPDSTASTSFPSSYSSSSSSSPNATMCDSLQCNSTSKYDEYRRHHDLVSSEREYNGSFASPMSISLSKFPSRNIQGSEFGFRNKSVRKSSSSLKEIVSNYFDKVNHLHKKLFQNHQQQQQEEQNQNIININNVSTTRKTKRSFPRNNSRNSKNSFVFFHCFSGNFQHPRKKTSISSYLGASRKKGFLSPNEAIPVRHANTSSNEELIKEAIAYCKNSMKQ